MSVLDRAVLAERTMTVQRHLARVAERLPAAAGDLLLFLGNLKDHSR